MTDSALSRKLVAITDNVPSVPDGTGPDEIWTGIKYDLRSADDHDLTGVEYGFNAKGEIQLEKKDDMKKRGLASPDIDDALALAFALPVSANSEAALESL